MNDKALVSEEMVRRAIFYCPHELSTPAKHRWMANTLNREVQAALGVVGWRPIAEAPRDKQFFAADMHFDIGIAYWHEKNPYWGIPDRYEWVTSGWGDSPPPVYYLPSPPPSSEEG